MGLMRGRVCQCCVMGSARGGFGPAVFIVQVGIQRMQQFHGSDGRFVACNVVR